MGYELHITRRENWFDEEDIRDISLSDWKVYVENDPDMRFESYATAKISEEEDLLYSSEGLSVWTKYSKDGIQGNHAWFDHSNGNISVKNPDPEIVEKMVLIAEHFKAKVQGDDGEFYDSRNSYDN